MSSTDDVYEQHFSQLSLLVTKIHRSTRLTPNELLVLLLYPFTISLGQLISFTSSLVASPSYYASKKNFLNVIFVKQGWFWTTIVLVFYLIQHQSRIRNGWKVILRVSLGTLWWVLFTQWFFGLPIMDRVFVASGGVCVVNNDIPMGRAVGEFVSDQLSNGEGSLACRKLKGQWVGGHDPSGHVFLLVHGSLMVWFEVLEVGFVAEVLEVISQLKRSRTLKEAGLILVKSSVTGVLIILGIWWWMLLITSMHFHTVLEKVSGLLFGLVGLLIYILPRFF